MKKRGTPYPRGGLILSTAPAKNPMEWDGTRQKALHRKRESNRRGGKERTPCTLPFLGGKVLLLRRHGQGKIVGGGSEGWWGNDR